MLETWNFVLSTQPYVVLENKHLSPKTLVVLLMSEFFFAKNQHFSTKIVPLLKAIVGEIR